MTDLPGSLRVCPENRLWEDVLLANQARSVVDLTDVPGVAGQLHQSTTQKPTGVRSTRCDPPGIFGVMNGPEGRFPVSKIVLWPDSD